LAVENTEEVVEVKRKFTELTTDNKLKLMSGEPFFLERIGNIRPLTLREIARIGYQKYIEHLNLFLISKKNFIKEEFIDEIDINFFNIMIAFSDEDFDNYIKKSIKTFFGIDTEVVKENLMIIAKDPEIDFCISSDNFDDIRQVIKWQNGLDDEKVLDDEVKYKNERAKQILDKLKKSQAEIQKQKKKEKNDLDFADIISAIASKSFSLNKLNVFDLTVYQMYDEFKRLDLIDNYHLATQAMMQGAKNINLKHWTSKINN
jgi:hypothetical protein